MTTTATPQPHRRVRVWSRQHVLADYNAEAASAGRYVHAGSRRFAGRSVANDPSPSAPPTQQEGS